jgi:hypothetical protein
MHPSLPPLKKQEGHISLMFTAQNQFHKNGVPTQFNSVVGLGIFCYQKLFELGTVVEGD